MSILVDYRCTSCGACSEHWESSPPAPVRACVSCGHVARRLFAAIGLASASGATAGSGRASSASPDSRGAMDMNSVAPRAPALCRQYPQIPGLCHMTDSAQRRWVATYTRDSQAQEREIAKQEICAKEKAPTLADAISPHHQHTT